MYKCSKCEKSFDRYKSLSRHAGVTHGISSDQFYVDYSLGGVWPHCKCGCGERVMWSWKLKGFCDFCHGHYSRIHNNWGNNPLALQKSLETRKERFETGEISTWNNGLSAETDDRVKKNGEAVSAAFDNDRKKQYSKIMRRNRLNGTVPTLRGKDHSQWNGGTSSVSMLVYNDVRFYEEWKRPILKRDDFKCIECGATKPLHVHHDKERLCEIIKSHVGDGIDTSNFDLKRKIADAVVDYHIKNKVSGITLCEECHGKIHPSLNFC